MRNIVWITDKVVLLILLCAVTGKAIAYKFNEDTTISERVEIENSCEYYTKEIMIVYRFYVQEKSDEYISTFLTSQRRTKSEEYLINVDRTAYALYLRDKKKAAKQKKKNNYYNETYYELLHQCYKKLEGSLYGE